MARAEIKWDDAKLAEAIRTMPKRVHKALVATVAYHAPKMQSAARRGAPWNDQTGNARQGLLARPRSSGFSGAEKGSYAVVLAHSVSYGIWLEISRAGRYAIIRPVIVSEAPGVMRTATVLVGRAMGGQ